MATKFSYKTCSNAALEIGYLLFSVAARIDNLKVLQECMSSLLTRHLQQPDAIPHCAALVSQSADVMPSTAAVTTRTWILWFSASQTKPHCSCGDRTHVSGISLQLATLFFS